MGKDDVYLDFVVHVLEGLPGPCRSPLTAISGKSLVGTAEESHRRWVFPPPKSPDTAARTHGAGGSHASPECGVNVMHLGSLRDNMLLSALTEPECAGEPGQKPQLLS